MSKTITAFILIEGTRCAKGLRLITVTITGADQIPELNPETRYSMRLPNALIPYLGKIENDILSTGESGVFADVTIESKGDHVMTTFSKWHLPGL